MSPRSARRRRLLASLVGVALLGAGAPASDPELDALAARIEALERAVAADEATLERLISDPATASRLHENAEVKAIAERLPRLQAELRALRDELRPPDAD